MPETLLFIIVYLLVIILLFRLGRGLISLENSLCFAKFSWCHVYSCACNFILRRLLKKASKFRNLRHVHHLLQFASNKYIIGRGFRLLVLKSSTFTNVCGSLLCFFSFCKSNFYQVWYSYGKINNFQWILKL